MRHLSFFAVFVFLMISTPAMAIYKCTVNGKVTFSDIPCAQGSGQETIHLQGQSDTRTNNSDLHVPHKPLETKPPEIVVDACFEHYKNRLLDPRGAYVVSADWSLVTPSNGKTYNELVVDARGKNKLGGFIPVTMYCAVTSEGEQIPSIMKMYDAFFDLNMTPPR